MHVFIHGQRVHLTVYIYYLSLVRKTLFGVGRQGGSSYRNFTAKTGKVVFPSIIIYFYKLYLKTLAFWKNLEDSTPILRVPLSIFDVLRFTEEAPNFPDNFFRYYNFLRRGFGVCFFWIISHVRSRNLLEDSVIEGTFEADCIQWREPKLSENFQLFPHKLDWIFSSAWSTNHVDGLSSYHQVALLFHSYVGSLLFSGGIQSSCKECFTIMNGVTVSLLPDFCSRHPLTEKVPTGRFPSLRQAFECSCL